ncbi:MAG: hypothetical protein M1826_004046 [Phylliscum demangeonii]|nr:MAG: hypothetical protein M1826_004046 [Phylliscum demangeonii]
MPSSLDEKRPHALSASSATVAVVDVEAVGRQQRRRRELRPWILLLVLWLCASYLYYPAIFSRRRGAPRRESSLAVPSVADSSLAPPQQARQQQHPVPLEIHIMSKCPDARDCLADLVLPTMERVGEKVAFRLSFIGSASDRDDSVICKHGPGECLGNMIELCAAHLYDSQPMIYLGFVMCLTRDYGRIPDQDLVMDCALEHAVDFERLNQCVSSTGGEGDDGKDGQGGMALLRESVARSERAGVTKSCTIRLDGKIRCVRDGGEWMQCDGGHTVSELVRSVEQSYEA